MLGQEHTPEYFVMGMYLSKMTDCISHVQLAMTKYNKMGMYLSKMTDCISHVQLAMTKYNDNKKEKGREGEKYHGPFVRDFMETFPVTPSCQF